MSPSVVTLGTLKTDLPLALFPVRLETRFEVDAQGQFTNVLVRVFPDTIHVDSFEPELTQPEVERGKSFWRQTWLAGRDERRKRAAWASLASVFGPERAAWIAENLTPENPLDQPTAAVPPSNILPTEPRFPVIIPQSAAWTRAPYSRILPDRWIAIGYSGQVRIVAEGQPIISPLTLGLSPQLGPEQIKNDQDLGWLVDFKKAETAGMALRIPLASSGSVIDRFDRLLVLGVNTSIPIDQSKTELETLLRAHHHTDGLGFVLQGTPTNNTRNAPSGYRSNDPDFEASYKVERGPTAPLSPESNGRAMARALGIDEGIFAHVQDTGALEQADAEQINRILWPTTWGYYLEQLMAGPGAPSDAAIQHARAHFEKYVRARGPLPALRIGNQPYGVLPVMSITRWQPQEGDAIDVPLVEFLRKLRDEWQKGVSEVPTVAEATSNGTQTLFDILTMTPLSATYTVRRGQRVELISEPPPSPKAYLSGSGDAKTLAAILGLSWTPSQVRMMMENRTSPLKIENGVLPSGLEESDLARFSAFFKGLDALPNKPEIVLDRLLREALDLCSHRYDAWVTSFATKRLDSIRNGQPNGQPKGICFGGYGWVENLVPAAERDRVSNHPSGLSPVHVSDGNQGFVHAPSLAHATTAAVLRSGYVSRRETGEGPSFAVNLSSERVRIALTLLEGVRQGQSLGALLGYRFERGLHENHVGEQPSLTLDQYISGFRQVAPLEVKASMSDSELKILPATNVVDGLALLQKFKTESGEQIIPWGRDWGEGKKLPVSGSREFTACITELKNLEDAVDAISDLVLAESVHHVAQGNPVGAGATLDAIAAGEAPPPELDVIHTPRSGIGITHRLAVLFCGEPNSPVWGTTTARARAEPLINAWAAHLLGQSAREAVCRVRYIDASQKDAPLVLAHRYVTLDDLKLAPIDVVYLPEGEEAQRSELELRACLHAYNTKPPPIPDTASLQLAFIRDSTDAEWPADSMGFSEVLEVARAVRRLVTNARPLQPTDLDRPEATISPAQEQALFTQLADRANAAVVAFQKACGELERALPADPSAALDRAAVHAILLQLAEFGLSSAVPRHDDKARYEAKDSGRGSEGKPSLRLHAESVLREATRRRTRIANLTPDTKNYDQARLSEVFGPDFLVMPSFALSDSTALSTSLAASELLQGGNPLESLTWLQRAARVREAAARLDTVLLYAGALGNASLRLTVGQLPYNPAAPERWAGLPGPLSGSRLSFVLHTPGKLDLRLPLSGLMIDEWVETVPSKEETTGLAFHFDSPQSRAPQAVLLAVSPDKSPEWDLETLEATILETIELMKLRTVDLQSLAKIQGLGSFLPAIFVAQNG